MPDKKQWDLTSASSLGGALEWLRKRSGAALIVAIRGLDVGVSIDPRIQPFDATNMLRDELPRLLQFLIDERAKKARPRQSAARETHGRNPDAEDPDGKE